MDLSPATLAVTAGRPAVEPGAPLNEPVVLSSTYHAGGEIGYGRYGNPTWSAFEEAVGALEGGQALAFASGIAAISAVLAPSPREAWSVAPSDAYSGTVALLQQSEGSGRLEVRRYEASDPADALRLLPGSDSCGWSRRPTRCSTSRTYPQARRQPTPSGRPWQWMTRS